MLWNVTWSGDCFRWHREAEAAADNNNWTQRTPDIQLLCIDPPVLWYLGVGKNTRCLCVCMYIILCCRVFIVLSIDSLLIALRPLTCSSHCGMCWVRGDNVNGLNLHEKCVNACWGGGVQAFIFNFIIHVSAEFHLWILVWHTLLVIKRITSFWKIFFFLPPRVLIGG